MATGVAKPLKNWADAVYAIAENERGGGTPDSTRGHPSARIDTVL
jgi:hypothetical protein